MEKTCNLFNFKPILVHVFQTLTEFKGFISTGLDLTVLWRLWL